MKKIIFQILVSDENGWRLVTPEQNKHRTLASPLGHKILNSAWFRLLVMCIILSNGIAMATMNFKHDKRQRHEIYEKYYYIEVIIFYHINIVYLIFKILYFYTFRSYIQSFLILKHYLKWFYWASKNILNIHTISLN